MKALSGDNIIEEKHISLTEFYKEVMNISNDKEEFLNFGSFMSVNLNKDDSKSL